MAILYRVASGTPILVAANREERFDRPTQYPKIQSGYPRVVCGIDLVAGGTWLGVNQFGLFCAVANRRKANPSPNSLVHAGCCVESCWICARAKDAAAHAAKELATGAYAGANYVCADARYAAVVHGGQRVRIVELKPGLHIITGADVDDPRNERHDFVRRMLTLQTLDSAVTFLAVASRVFSRKPDSAGRRGVVILGGEVGTVSSTLLSLPRKIQQAIYQYAPGPPCDCAYDDLSALLRQVLSTRTQPAAPGRQRRGRQALCRSQGENRGKGRLGKAGPPRNASRCVLPSCTTPWLPTPRRKTKTRWCKSRRLRGTWPVWVTSRRPLSCTLDLAALRDRLRRQRPDAVFNLVESLDGSDSLSYLPLGVLDVLGLPYTGSSTQSLLLTTHKLMAKRLMRQAGLPTPDWIEPSDEQPRQG